MYEHFTENDTLNHEKTTYGCLNQNVIELHKVQN